VVIERQASLGFPPMRRVLLLSAVIAVMPLVAACSTSGGEQPPACDTPTETTTVDMQEVAFAPACVSATASDTLSLVNHDSTAHTFTVEGTSVNVNIEGGQTAQAPLTGIAPGTYAVTCQFHPTMTEVLRVT
jgi:plastocyanin